MLEKQHQAHGLTDPPYRKKIDGYSFRKKSEEERIKNKTRCLKKMELSSGCLFLSFYLFLFKCILWHFCTVHFYKQPPAALVGWWNSRLLSNDAPVAAPRVAFIQMNFRDASLSLPGERSRRSLLIQRRGGDIGVTSDSALCAKSVSSSGSRCDTDSERLLSRHSPPRLSFQGLVVCYIIIPPPRVNLRHMSHSICNRLFPTHTPMPRYYWPYI